MVEFLLFGTFWFWMFITLNSLFLLTYIIANDETENVAPIWLLGVILVIILILGGTVNFSIIKPLELLTYVGIYIVVGLVWSFFEWYKFVNKKANDLLIQYSHKTIEDRKIFIQTNMPRVGNNWSRIVVWIVYFPYYVLAWVLTEPFKFIATKFRFMYSLITNFIEKKTISRLK